VLRCRLPIEGGQLNRAIAGEPGSREATLPLISRLCRALEAEGVSYCHWKSNAFLDRTRTGRNDLDLLIRRSDSSRFSAVLHGLEFKRAETPKRALPGIMHYYGYDRSSARLVHVHAHYQLVVGDDLTKNYRISLENVLLDASVSDGEFRVPIPELELILLVIRIAVKHSTWDSFIARRSRVSPSALEELAFLRDRSDDELVQRLLRQHLPWLRPTAFAECIRSLEPGVGRWSRLRAGQRLAADLSPYARRRRGADLGLKLWRRGVGIVRRVVGRPARGKRLVNGGFFVALVGADGAGKSTVVEGLETWLGKDFSVTRLHLGKPPRSWTTATLTGLNLVRLAVRAALGRRGRPPDSDSRLRMLLAVATARDRYGAYRKARGTASNGGLVVCDRFPLPQLTLMDAPRLARTLPPGAPSRLGRRLASLERGYYERLALPDLLIVLRVEPEVAVARKAEEAPDFVRARSREIWEMTWQQGPARLVDANRPAADVLATVKELVWSEL
jgi:thymidylate kinase